MGETSKPVKEIGVIGKCLEKGMGRGGGVLFIK